MRAKGGLIAGLDALPIFTGPDGYVMSARQLREIGADLGLLAKLNARDDGRQA